MGLHIAIEAIATFYFENEVVFRNMELLIDYGRLLLVPNLNIFHPFLNWSQSI